MNNSYKEVTVVIISHRSKKKVLNLVKKISNNFKIIIVENSYDKSIGNELLDLRKNTQIIFSENKGYGSAVNLARKKIYTKYFFVLNPDMQKINDELITAFYNSAKELNDNFGALGPRFENVNKKSHRQSNINEKYGHIDSISGSAMFFCSEVFDRNRGFDENFFLYFEEIDLCKNCKKNGGKIYLDKKIIINHIGAGSVKSDYNIELEKNRNWHWMWSTFYFHRKHKGYFTALLILIPKLFSSFLKIIFYQLTFNNQKKNIYFCRMSGIINSMIGKKSWYRPSID